MTIAINLVMIIISIVLIFILLLQTKGSAFSGNFGQGDSIQRTRRGFEKTLFQFTIGIAVFFVISAVISSFALN